MLKQNIPSSTSYVDADASAGFVNVVMSLPPHLKKSEGPSFPPASCSSERLVKDSRPLHGGAMDGAGRDEKERRTISSG